MVGGTMFAFVGFIWLLGILGLIATIWVIYDVITKQTKMDTTQKLIWVIVALFLGLIGAIIYYFVVKKEGKYEEH
jgi:prolipoprotein diacylglyceryltransferase